MEIVHKQSREQKHSLSSPFLCSSYPFTSSSVEFSSLAASSPCSLARIQSPRCLFFTSTLIFLPLALSSRSLKRTTMVPTMSPMHGQPVFRPVRSHTARPWYADRKMIKCIEMMLTHGDLVLMFDIRADWCARRRCQNCVDHQEWNHSPQRIPRQRSCTTPRLHLCRSRCIYLGHVVHATQRSRLVHLLARILNCWCRCCHRWCQGCSVGMEQYVKSSSSWLEPS